MKLGLWSAKDVKHPDVLQPPQWFIPFCCTFLCLSRQVSTVGAFLKQIIHTIIQSHNLKYKITQSSLGSKNPREAAHNNNSPFTSLQS